MKNADSYLSPNLVTDDYSKSVPLRNYTSMHSPSSFFVFKSNLAKSFITATVFVYLSHPVVDLHRYNCASYSGGR